MAGRSAAFVARSRAAGAPLTPSRLCAPSILPAIRHLSQIATVVDKLPPLDAHTTPAKLEFYKRDLPSTCIPFTSPEGKKLFAEALQDGTLECYFPLAAQFRTQEEPAYCGLTTLVMVLNALSIDPRRLWKGPWRWFSEDMLDCCRPLPEIKERGIDLNVFTCLASCHSAVAELYRPPADGMSGPVSEDMFRSMVLQMSQRAEHEFLVLSYYRQLLGQTGDGHFSPMGGYHRGQDMLLVLDVARFKYMPHWVPVKSMWRAMQAIDKETSKPRGFVKLRRRAAAPLLFFQLSSSQGEPMAGSGGATCLNRRLRTSLERAVATAKTALTDSSNPVATGGDLQEIVTLFVTTFLNASLKEGGELTGSRCVDKLSKEHIEVAGALVSELEQTALYPMAVRALEATQPESSPTAGSLLLKFDGDDSVNVAPQPSWKAVGCKTCGVSCIRVHKAHVMTLLLLSFASPSAAGCNEHHETAAAARLCDTAQEIMSHASELLQQETSLLAEQLRAAACTLNPITMHRGESLSHTHTAGCTHD